MLALVRVRFSSIFSCSRWCIYQLCSLDLSMESIFLTGSSLKLFWIFMMKTLEEKYHKHILRLHCNYWQKKWVLPIWSKPTSHNSSIKITKCIVWWNLGWKWYFGIARKSWEINFYVFRLCWEYWNVLDPLIILRSSGVMRLCMLRTKRKVRSQRNRKKGRKM